MIRHTSRVVVCGRIGNVRVCNEPLYSSGIITRNTDEQAGNEDDRNCNHDKKRIANYFDRSQIVTLNCVFNFNLHQLNRSHPVRWL